MEKNLDKKINKEVLSKKNYGAIGQHIGKPPPSMLKWNNMNIIRGDRSNNQSDNSYYNIIPENFLHNEKTISLKQKKNRQKFGKNRYPEVNVAKSPPPPCGTPVGTPNGSVACC